MAEEGEVSDFDLSTLKKFRCPSDSSVKTCTRLADLQCSRCKQQYYCSPQCQKSDWKYHKTVCTPIAAGAKGTPLPLLGDAYSYLDRQLLIVAAAPALAPWLSSLSDLWSIGATCKMLKKAYHDSSFLKLII